MPPEASAQPVLEPRYAQAILGTETAFYQGVFQRLQTGHGPELNPAATAGGLMWLWYRKLFGWGTLAYSAALVTTTLLTGQLWLGLVAGHALVGFLGNNLLYATTHQVAARYQKHYGVEQGLMVLASRRPAVCSPLELVALTLVWAALHGVVYGVWG